MKFSLPESGVSVELHGAGRKKLPADDVRILPSRSTFLMPITLPARAARGLTDAQWRALAFDRIPMPPDAVRLWMIIPRVSWFSRGLQTAWAVAAPIARLQSPAEICVPEDVILAVLTFEKRFSGGGVIALDAGPALTLIGMGPSRTGATAVKHFIGPAGLPQDAVAGMTGYLGKGARILHVNAGGAAKEALARFGVMTTEEAGVCYSEALKTAVNPRRYRLAPELAPPAAAAAQGAVPASAGRGKFYMKVAFVSLSLILPFVALGAARERCIRVTAEIDRRMGDGYERRFGARVPDPMIALRAKAQNVSSSSRSASTRLAFLLSAVNRVTRSASDVSLRIDAVSLDGARVEIRGTAADLKSVAQWVSAMTGDSHLADAALVSSETRQSDKRTVFLVRARMQNVAGKSS